ncbi:vanadium-dependent haloperoxidase [Cesiribacter andamanensis]|uniref:PAP2 superfamily protein n=1 Tax=Cesiribacter andamanensis AMV16 TaxID=1279009 RepID=M7NQN0_9BACT|nr:vanadium-dependent haloperoxidase [Cesiribacter andamanensis]EMR00794.1 PAP2 superfamily protein [Cesiribacter andamanensis AMV16]
MKRAINYFLGLALLVTSACVSTDQPEKEVHVPPLELHQSVQKLTDVIVHDIFSPPVASRIYAYASIAAYEVLVQQDSAYLTLAGQLNGLEPLPKPGAPIHWEVAAVDAYLQTGRALIFSEEKIEDYRQQWHQRLLEQGMSRQLLDQTTAYSQAVASHILAWSGTDNYKQTRTFEKHSIDPEPGKWQPTPPAYMEAIEPHWNKIRPFVLDSSSQFKPAAATPFSAEKGSPFYNEMLEVYETAQNLSEEQKEIASFWDCNPYVMNVRGHVMFAAKKITPGGHWMGITKIACQKAGAPLMQSAQAYALTAVALADGFISCWDEKYRSNVIRPETVINRYIDESWEPLLQTPPFPEYPSGHSVISTAASVVLTDLFGPNFSFVDSTEVRYGLGFRSFTSFTHAAEEAAISRLYGGIHYMPAIENGVKEGRSVGEWVVKNLKTTMREEEQPLVAERKE